jgi:alpha-D-ribose 1-methylphosphonate 5-triphosphate synthase subunit PhnG
MTRGKTNEGHEPRQTWLGVLARASRAELEEALIRLGPLPALEHVRPSEPGMFMLRGRMGGTGDAFNLGEATVTRCALRVGSGALGVGYAIGRDRRKAELIAVFDALLQGNTHQTQIQRDAIEPMARRQVAARDAASGQAATSRVEFFTMVRGET